MYKSDFEALRDNAVWKEIVSTLEEVQAGLIMELKDIDPFTDPGILARKQGRLKMIEFVLKQPEAILMEIEETANKEERKEG